MLFSVGTKVKLKHTGDRGVVTSLLDNGMVNVHIESADMEIPVYPDDLIRAESDYGKAKILKTKLEKQKPEPSPPLIESQYKILKSYGIQLAFDPLPNPEGMTKKYAVFLLNDRPHDVIYDLTLTFAGKEAQRWNGKLEARSFLKLGHILFDDLNDHPAFEMDCWESTTEGLGKKHHKSLKIRPKQFFKNIKTAPFLNKKVHIYLLFDQLDSAEETEKEDLKNYTIRQTKPVKFTDPNLKEIGAFDSNEYAEFVPELDLHIENLTGRKQKMTNAEIVRIQLAHFDDFIAKAIRLGVPRVFVIHGVGKGRLRDEIASRLFQNPDVRTFKNEYHPRYGWGATEVIF